VTLFLVLAAVLAPLNWYAVLVSNRRLEWVAKPGVMLCLSLWFGTHFSSSLALAGAVFLLGMLFSLGGDIFLMLDRRHFIKGLLAFLLAHLAYIIVFNLPGLILDLRSLALFAPIALAVWLLVNRIITALRASGKASLVPPVAVYAAVLMLTCWSTLVTLLRPGWSGLAAWSAAAGGVLFLLSDSLLAWDRFVQPIPRGRFWTMLSYHWAQFMLAVSVLLFLGLAI
jgi:alkenylglycerophosphocholine/alkenylglycerophosphoethanolamine hydrolase